MTTSGRAPRTRGRRAHGDDGAAMVEFALVAVLLFTLIFGIIQFGLILNFKQDVTRAAAEGARAGAVAVAADGETAAAAATSAATRATGEAIDGMGGRFSGEPCSPGGKLPCTVTVGPCAEDPARECVTVELSYQYKDDPLFGDIPLISAFFPERVHASSVARIND